MLERRDRLLARSDRSALPWHNRAVLTHSDAISSQRCAGQVRRSHYTVSNWGKQRVSSRRWRVGNRQVWLFDPEFQEPCLSTERFLSFVLFFVSPSARRFIGKAGKLKATVLMQRFASVT